METLGNILAVIANDLKQETWLNVVLAVITVLPFVGGAGALIMKRIYRSEREQLRQELALAENQTKLKRERIKEQDKVIALLELRLRKESPAEWRALAEFERQPDQNNAVKAVAILDDGFEHMREDLRAVTLDLARHYSAITELGSKDALKKAWYLSGITAALADREDVREVRDGIREIEAEIDRQCGDYDPGDPKWRQFDLVPTLATSDDVASLLHALRERAQKLMAARQRLAAQRLMARVVHIGKLQLPSSSRLLLSLRGLYAQMTLLIHGYQAAFEEFDEAARMAESALGPKDILTLTLFHLRAGALNAVGRHEEFKQAVADLLRVVEAELGPDHPLTLATRTMAQPNVGRRHPMKALIPDFDTSDIAKEYGTGSAS